MKVKFKEVVAAYEKANADGYKEKASQLDKETGVFYFQTEAGDGIPAVVAESGNLVSMPERRGFDLGPQLVFRFIKEVMPDAYKKVSEIFTRRGAYARYNKWLAANHLLGQWTLYAKTAEEGALREWCAKAGVELEG